MQQERAIEIAERVLGQVLANTKWRWRIEIESVEHEVVPTEGDGTVSLQVTVEHPLSGEYVHVSSGRDEDELVSSLSEWVEDEEEFFFCHWGPHDSPNAELIKKVRSLDSHAHAFPDRAAAATAVLLMEQGIISYQEMKWIEESLPARRSIEHYSFDAPGSSKRSR